MPHPPRPNSLRFAFATLCGIAATLIAVLWVRSYYVSDTIHLRYRPSHYAWIVPERGRIVIELSEIKNNPGISTFAIDHLDPTQLHFAAQNHYWFHVVSLGNLTEIYIPMWTLILAFNLLGAASLIKWRFSLRMLFFATMIVALVLALAASRR